MKNCHKRWKKQKKEEDRKMRESADRSRKGLDDMLHFFQKHPDQAIYEMGKYTKGERPESISEMLK